MAIQCALVLQLVRSIDIKNSSVELFAVRTQLLFDIQMSGLTVFAACTSKRVAKP